MYRRLLFLAFIYIVVSSKLYAQVNLQTGSATFSIPMFNWQDDKSRLNSLVALSYNSGNGLKVNSVASNVGEGWSMIAGGVITRMQVGEPDDQRAYGSAAESDIHKYPAGYLYATVPPENGCPTALTRYPIYKSMNQVYKQHNVLAEDKQLDYFGFQFNGKSGMFILDPKHGDNGVMLGDSRIKITFQRDHNMATNNSSGIRTTITSFTIQDVDGLIYRFSRKGLTKVLQSNYCDANLVQSQTQPKFKDGKVYHQAGFDLVTVNPWIVNSWHLAEIEDPLTHRKVTFNYITRYSNARAGQDVAFNDGDKGYCIITHRTSITQSPELSSIWFPDQHMVTFNYGSTQRPDLNGHYPLASVDISYVGKNLSKYKLNTTYMILNRYGTPSTDYQKRVARLCLKSVQKVGVNLRDESLPYIFDYYMGSSNPDDFVPPPFFYAKDTWGYYNGSNTVGWEHGEAIPLSATVQQLSYSQVKGLCFLRKSGGNTVFTYYNTKNNYAKNGLMRQIIYPTGGTLTYSYEQNTGPVGGSAQTVGGVHVSQTSSTDGGYSNGCGNPLTTSYNYILSGGGSSLWGLEAPVSSMTTYNHYQPEKKYYKWSWSCAPFGCCDWRFQYPGILSQQQSVDLPNWIAAVNTISPVLGVLNTLSLIKDIITVASGGNPVALIIDVVLNLIQVAITCIGDQSKDKAMGVYYNFDLNGSNPLPVQFRRVEIVENPGTRGKTIQEFTSDEDYALWTPSNPDFVQKQRYASWAYGLPKKITVMDANGYKVKETENEYDYMYASHILEFCGSHGISCNQSGVMSSLVSCQCVVVKNTSQRNDDWANSSLYNAPSSYTTTSTGDLKVNFYGHYTGRVELRNTYERTFKPNSNTDFVESKTYFLYNEHNYMLQEIQKYDVGYNFKIERFTYSCDYNTGILATMNQNNMVNVPVTTTTSYYKTFVNYSDMGIMSEKVTEFSMLSNGDIRPYRMMEQRFDKPMPTYNPGGPTFRPYYGPGNPYNATYQVTQNLTYDGNSNLIGIQDEGGRTVTNIYGYLDKYLIASIVNASPGVDNCSYADFEIMSGWYGWTLHLPLGGGPVYSTTSITGYRALSLQNGANMIAPVNSAKAYIVSFWSTAPLSVTNASLVKSVPGINGYTYYEYELPSGNSYVTVSGTGVIDELRLYPKNARMRTVAYDPGLGKIAECDENNRITYYEYDNAGRLHLIRDDKRNIVKMYEYNNISPAKQNGCPGVYYNRALSETFTKNNCGPGYIGSEVTYTLPANIYSSTKSQEDADAQADTYLMTYGQNYANTYGSCIPVYYNTAQSQSFATASCPEGYLGGTVTYTVPAGRYYSTVSQAEADQMALDEIEANGQAYANDPANATCSIDYNPYWQWEEGGATQCQMVNGQMHMMYLATDVNPNSSTYNQSSWQDGGPSNDCPYYSTFDLYYYNNTSCGQYITLTNTTTWEQHYFYVYPWSSGILGYISEGTYDISISNDCWWYYSFSYWVGCWNYYTYGSQAYFYNVYLNSGCNYISIQQ
jgi:hypothetical protein